MRVKLHRLVYSDIAEIMNYYERVAGMVWRMIFIARSGGSLRKAANQPGRFRVYEGDLRRVNLARFPYHFLFRVKEESIRVLVVRHNSRDPSFGLERT